METVALRPGYRISRLIKGGWQLAGDHGPVEPERAVADMAAFVDAGIVAFDCADIYTGVEEMIGAFLARLAAARGVVEAAAVRVHTKYVPDLASAGPGSIGARSSRGIDRSLARLGRERLDLVQFHWWDLAVPGWAECAGHLAALQAAGKIDRIGVTNFDEGTSRDHRLRGRRGLCPGPVLAPRPAPGGGLRRVGGRERGRDLRLRRARGRLPDRPVARGARSRLHFQEPIARQVPADHRGVRGWGLFQDLLRALRGIADRRGADIAAVAVRAVLDAPGVAAVILGARYADRLPRTLRAFSIALDDTDRAAIRAVQARARGPAGPVYALERDRNGPHGRIMKYGLQEGAGEGVPPTPDGSRDRDRGRNRTEG